MRVKGITKRWVFNSLGLVIFVLTILVISFALIMRGYFYSGIQQTISGRSNELANIFSGYSWQSPIGFSKTVRSYVEEFPDEKLMELMVFNDKDEILITSTGFPPKYDNEMPDYELAKESDDNCGFWTGVNSSGEKVMAVTRILYGQYGSSLGAVRYVVSLEDADSRIFYGVMFLLGISILIILFVILSGLSFVKSIVIPVTEVVEIAKTIARGNFKTKIKKKYDDEIGELCDTINYMAEELDASEKLKNDFISSVSHEIRTPLTAIKGWAETMQDGSDIDKSVMKRGLDIIVHETERLSGIVEELLDFSRLQSGRMIINKDKIDILAEIGEAVYMFKDRASAEGKTLTYNEPRVLSPIRGDKNRLKQVFINLIDNALKYTPSGGGVSVSASEKEGKILINITDNGCGIPHEHLDKIREKFYKANSTQRGSGIGLAIVDEIVSLHNGSMEIISEENFGTTVILSFPVLGEGQHLSNDKK